MVEFLLFWLFVFVLVLLVLVSRMTRRVQKILDEVQGVSRRLSALERSAEAPQVEEHTEPLVADVLPCIVPPPLPPKVPAPVEVSEEPVVPQVPKAPEVPQPPKKQSLVVRFLTEHTLAKLGILTLILGVGFFVKYAIDQDWINELFRVFIGLVVGGALLGLGHKLRKNYAVFSSILAGGGVAVFYLSVVLAFRQYELLSQWSAFGCLMLVTALSVFLAFYYNRKELAIISLIGGFVAPFFVGLRYDDFMVFFSYLLLLNSGMMVVSFRKKWFVIGTLAFVATNLLLWIWLLQYGLLDQMLCRYSADQNWVGVFFAAFYVQFCALALWHTIRRMGRGIWHSVGLLVSHNLLSFLAMSRVFPDDVQWVTLAYMGVNLLGVIWVYGRRERFAQLFYVLIGLTILFLSVYIPLLLDGQDITTCWVAESVLLIWLWRKSRFNIFAWGFIVLTAALLFSFLRDFVCIPILDFDQHPQFWPGVVVVLASWLGYFLFKKGDPDSEVCLWGKRPWFKLRVFQSVWLGLGLFYAFVVPFVEIRVQAAQHCAELKNWLGFGYFFVYAAVVLFFAMRRRGSSLCFLILSFLLLGLYVLVYVPMSYILSGQIADQGATELVRGLFWLHWLVFASVAFLWWSLWCNLAKQGREIRVFVVLLHMVGIVSVTALVDFTVLSICVPQWSVGQVTEVMGSVVHPILWALMASGLMIWGLKRPDAFLRKLSLVFFLLIVGRFYVYDVWQMSQAGRIIAFVGLGLILLAVSFLQQKIKRLISNEDLK